MTAAALLTLAASWAAADPAACSSAYKPEYADEWGAKRTAWDALCRKGYDGSDVLRELQRASVAACTSRFQTYEAKGKIPAGQAQAFCAQGSEGRAALAAAAGLPAERPKPPPGPRIPPARPGASGMGPLEKALGRARRDWNPGACFSGLRYEYHTTGYSSCDEIESALKEGRTARVTDTAGIDDFTYYFYSDSVERDVYAAGSHLRVQECPFALMPLPSNDMNLPKVAGLSACLQGVKVDLGQAFDIAAQNGWKPDLPVGALLAAFPPGFFAKACGRGTAAVGDRWYNTPVTCGEDWDQAKLRRATGGPVWMLTSRDKTAVVDAVTGRFRFLGEGVFSLGAPR